MSSQVAGSDAVTDVCDAEGKDQSVENLKFQQMMSEILLFSTKIVRT